MLLDYDATPEDILEQADDRQVRLAVAGLAAFAPGDELKERFVLRNSFNLLNGNYGAARPTKSGTQYKGVGSGSVFQRKTIASVDSVFDGVVFRGSADNHAELVLVKVGATVLFRNCTFDKNSDDDKIFVQIEAPSATKVARAIFVGCFFTGANKGDLIVNTGLVTDVQLLGCLNNTGGAYAAAGTVTVTGSL
jgi:hypothetical protein